MSRIKWVLGILVVSWVLLPAAVFAAEHGGKEHGGSTTASSSGTAAAPSDAAPTATVSTAAQPAVVTPPALKPITITFSGEISSINTTDTPPMIAVQDRYGVKKEISVPGEAKVAQGQTAKTLADLKAGDKVTVEYTYDVATGKRTAQTISIGEASPAGQ